MKACSTCGVAKAIDAFHRDATRASGYRGSCKDCESAKARAKYASNAEHRARAVQAAKKNRKPFSEWSDERRENHRLRKTRNRRKVTEARLAAKAERKAASEMRKAIERAARAGQTPHSAHVSTWKRLMPAAYFRHRYRNDPEFNAQYKVRARLRKIETIDGELCAYVSSHIKKGSKTRRWESMLGYTMTQLVEHLRRTLPRGATWEDFMQGRLHIDHIRPRSSFNLTNVDEVKACWCLSNLRLLSAADNIKKRDRMEFLL